MIRDGCRWITAGYLERAQRGEDIYCGQPVIGIGAWCKAHRARVYLPPGFRDRTVIDPPPAQGAFYLKLRRAGRSHDDALAVVLMDRAA